MVRSTTIPGQRHCYNVTLRAVRCGPLNLVLVPLLLLFPDGAAAAAGGWTHETLGAVWAAPMVAPGGRIYASSEDGFLYAFEPDGRLRWVYKASDGFSGWPVWVRRGLLAAGNRNGTLYLIDEQGEVKHRLTVDGAPFGPPAMVGPRMYIGTTAGKLVCATVRGVQWVHDTKTEVTAYPSASGRGVCGGTRDGTVFCLDPAGNRLWSTSLGSAIRGATSLVGQAVVVATESGTVAAMAMKDGKLLWQHEVGSGRGGVTALGAGVVLGTRGGEVVALGRDGTERWRFAADGAVQGTVLVKGNELLFGTSQGTLYLLGGDGAPQGLYTAGGELAGGITLDRGRALVGSTDRRLYAIPLRGGGMWRHARPLKRQLLRTTQGALLWRRDLSGPVACGVGPATRDRLLAGTWGNRMFVLQADGTVQWSYNCGADVDTLPVMDATGAVAFGCNDGGFYGLKSDGELRYRLPINKALTSSPAATRDGTVYFGARDGRIYSVDSGGKLLWRIRTGGDVDGAPRIGPDGVVYIGSDDRHLYAIDPMGHIAWYHKFPAPVRSRPALSRTGEIHVTGMDQRLHTLSPDGQELWDYPTAGQIVSWPEVGADGSIYFGSRDHWIHAVDPAGKPRWRFETASEVDSHPALSSDGMSLAVGSDDGNLYVLSTADGSLRWWYAARAAIRGSLVSRPDGSVVFGTMDGAVLAVASPGPTPTTRPATRPVEPDGPEHFIVGQGRYGPPLSLEHGTIVVAGVDGVVRAFGADRWLEWSVRVGSDRLSRPLLLPGDRGSDLFVTDARGALACIGDGQLRFRLRLDRDPLPDPGVVVTPEGPLVLVGTRAGRLWAVTPSGKVRWFHVGEEAIYSVLGLGRSVLVASGRRLTGLDLSGHQRWSLQMPAGITVGPVAVTESRSLVGDGLGNLWAVSASGTVVWKRDVGAGVRRISAPSDDSATVLTTNDRLMEIAVNGEVLTVQSPGVAVSEIAHTTGDVTYLVGVDGTVVGIHRRTGTARRMLELSSREIHLGRGPQGGAVVVSDDGRVTLLRQVVDGVDFVTSRTEH